MKAAHWFEGAPPSHSPSHALTHAPSYQCAVALRSSLP